MIVDRNNLGPAGDVILTLTLIVLFTAAAIDVLDLFLTAHGASWVHRITCTWRVDLRNVSFFLPPGVVTTSLVSQRTSL